MFRHLRVQWGLSLVIAALGAWRGGANVVVVNGASTGAPGDPGGGTLNSGTGLYNGNLGLPGYYVDGGSGNTYLFNGATCTGGAGGATAGSDAANGYNGGNGGDGLFVGGGGPSPEATINSGTFTGGVGGPASGVGLSLTGGYGGSGLNVNGASVLVNGGTFQGADSGPATGTGNLGGGFGGSGVNANDNSVITITGGTFIGGNAGQGGGAGAGILGLGGVVAIHGGTFTGAAGAFGPYGIDNYSSTMTIYGTNFTFNGIPMDSGPLTGSGTLTGIFEDNAGQTSTQVVDRAFGGSITLVVVPEPGGMMVLAGGTLLLFARSATRSRPRRTAAAG